MKALIFNSGLGSRLGALTEHNPKCLVRLGSGETIFHRQLRLLASCGIRDVVVTTGPYPEQVEAEARAFERLGLRFTFVNNDVYDQTNYLYSMWLAREALQDDEVLLLHGDLVFDAAYVDELLRLPAGSYGSVNPDLPLPEKDFKARVADGRVREVGVNTWGEDCLAFQAMYRLSPDALATWLDSIRAFVERGETGVYAENAANEVFAQMDVRTHSYEGHLLEEIDTPEDLERVSAMARAIDFHDQPVYLMEDGALSLIEGTTSGALREASDVPTILDALDATHPLVVADAFVGEELLELLLGRVPYVRFSDFAPNPRYEQVLDAIRCFHEGDCDAVVSLGGGSAIDVAKCVRLWASLSGDGTGRDADNPRYCDVPVPYSPIAHLACPTTAGTGSESTHFAVVYVEGEKRSIATQTAQPDVALLVPSLLAGLPPYQRKATMFDALCQAIESHWSRNSSESSRAYSARAIPQILDAWSAYLAQDAHAARTMHQAANLAGKAINLTTTTAAHAMSYKMSSLYGIAHGHAVALCLPATWERLLEDGGGDVRLRLDEIDALVCGAGASKGAGLARFRTLYDALDLPCPVADDAQLDLLARSVNTERLQNYPLELSTDEVRALYATILARCD